MNDRAAPQTEPVLAEIKLQPARTGTPRGDERVRVETGPDLTDKNRLNK